MKNFNLAFFDTISFVAPKFYFEECHLDEKGEVVITTRDGIFSEDEEKDVMIILERMWKTNTILEVGDFLYLGNTGLIVDEVCIRTLDGHLDIEFEFYYETIEGD